MFSARIVIMTSWSSDPKQSRMSPSMNQVVPFQVCSISVSAVWQPRPGRNPWEEAENRGS